MKNVDNETIGCNNFYSVKIIILKLLGVTISSVEIIIFSIWLPEYGKPTIPSPKMKIKISILKLTRAQRPVLDLADPKVLNAGTEAAS
jgi:hypothetical protein